MKLARYCVVIKKIPDDKYLYNFLKPFYCSQVNEAEEERVRSEREHMRVTQQCQAAEANVQDLQKSLKKSIIKSKPYFELKAQLNCMLEVSMQCYMHTRHYIKQ